MNRSPRDNGLENTSPESQEVGSMSDVLKIASSPDDQVTVQIDIRIIPISFRTLRLILSLAQTLFLQHEINAYAGS